MAGNGSGGSRPLDKSIQIALYIVAALCVLGAVLHAIWPDKVDEKTAIFLGAATVVLMIREVSKLEFGNWKIELGKLKEDVQHVDRKIDAQAGEVDKKIETRAEEVGRKIDAQVGQVDKKVSLIETSGLLPGGSAMRRPIVPAVVKQDHVEAKHGKRGADWYTDPNRGEFGGSPEANGRRLSATITPAAGPTSAACRIHLEVRSIDPAKPLTGVVTFHLHPTFKALQQYDVPVIEGVAQDDRMSWGVFTVGAEADGGATRLELNLYDVEGGTKKFYEN